MKMPRLPNAAVTRGHYQSMYLGSLYTAEQMRAYAQKCMDQQLERILDEWSACVQSDLEHGVKSLNEQAAEKWRKEYPAISSFAPGEV